jgi:hypothetical protein
MGGGVAKHGVVMVEEGRRVEGGIIIESKKAPNSISIPKSNWLAE